MTHVCERPLGIFIIVKYIISAHCQPTVGFTTTTTIDLNYSFKTLSIASM